MGSDIRPNIVLVDDDELFVAAQMRLHRRLGFPWELVGLLRGQELLLVLEDTRPDVIITDVLMPEVEGLELIRLVKQVAPEIPMIAISGGARHLVAAPLEAALQFGACAVLRKPFEIDELAAEIQSALCLREAA